jgi:phytanoyl-CoA hydroxylase
VNNMRTQDDWYSSASWVDDDAADIDAYVSRLKPHTRPPYDLKQKLEEWRTNGVVIFEGVVDHGLIDKVNEDIAFVLHHHDKYSLPVDGSHDVAETYRFLNRLSSRQVQEYNLRLVDIHTVSYNAALLTMVPEAVSFLRHVFGSEPALLQTLTFPIGSEQTVHQDFPYVFRQRDIAKLAAFWIPLEDIHPDSGPLAYYCGSHRVKTLGFFDWGDGAINQFDRFGEHRHVTGYESFLKERIEALGLPPRHFLPRKGDLLVWHGALVHAGSEIRNRSLTRKSLVGHYTAVGSHHWIEQHRLGGGFVFGAATNRDVRANQAGRAEDEVSISGTIKAVVKRMLLRHCPSVLKRIRQIRGK